MSTAVAESLVGASLKALAKGAGEEGVKEICSSLVGSILGGGDNSNAEADAKILDELDQIKSSLNQVQDSLQQIKQAIAQVDVDIVADDIQKQISILTAIHGLIINQHFLDKKVEASIGKAKDMIDFYNRAKQPLVKIAMVEIKGIHLLRFAKAAHDAHKINFADAQVAIQRALSQLDAQDQALPSAIGAKTYGLVSTILTQYPKPAPACINVYEKRGLTYGIKNGDSVWYGGENARLWHIEPANGPVVTNGSKVNSFRLLHVDSNKYISIQPYPPVIGLTFYNLGAVDSPEDAAIWNFHLTPEWKFHIQSQTYPDTFFATAQSGKLDGRLNDFWPGNVTEMHDGEYLLPGAWLEDASKRFKLTFSDSKRGVWDVKNKSWKWDSGVTIDTSSDPYLRFSGTGVMTLYQNCKQVKSWGPVQPVGTYYILGVLPSGALLIECDPIYPKWSSEA